MWFWIVVAAIAVAIVLLGRGWGSRGPRDFNQSKRDAQMRWTDPGNIDRHRDRHS